MFRMSIGLSTAIAKAYIMSRSSRGSARNFDGPGSGIDAGWTGSWRERIYITYWIKQAIVINIMPRYNSVSENDIVGDGWRLPRKDGAL